MSDDDNLQIIDAESSTGWGNKDGLTFQQILMQQLSRCTQNLSEDYIVGHWKKMPVKTGMGVVMTEVYIPDGRKKAINSIQTLYDLLLPRFDEDMKKADKEVKDKMEAKRKELKGTETSASSWIDYELKIYRKIFQELNLLISRLGYFTEEGVTM